MRYWVSAAAAGFAEWLSGTNVVEWTGLRIDHGDGSETVAVRSTQAVSNSVSGSLRLNIAAPY